LADSRAAKKAATMVQRMAGMRVSARVETMVGQRDAT